jgi:PAS domain S-box-containing protein
MSHGTGTKDQLQQEIRRLQDRLAAAESGRDAADRQRKQLLDLLEHLPFGIALVDAAERVLYLNDTCVDLLGYAASDLPTLGESYRKFYPDPAYRQTAYDAWVREFRRDRGAEGRIFMTRCKDGTIKDIEWYTQKLAGGRTALLLTDVTVQERAAAERDQLIHKVRSAHQQVRALRGLLPICASCKKIRDDSGYWHQVESYLQSHAGVEFSHGICPDCMGRLYPEFPGETAPRRDRTPVP